MNYSRTFAFLFFILCSVDTWSQAWEPVTGDDKLRALFSDTVMTATLKDGVTATATYNRDGTGELKAWGDTFSRRWQIKGDDQVCIDISDATKVDGSTNVYRGRDVASGETVVFTADEGQLTVTDKPSTGQGGASQPSAEEIAQKLANRNAPLASLTFRLQHRTYEGDLPDAGDQSNTTLTFQPTFPFSLDNGDVVFSRPSIGFMRKFCRNSYLLGLAVKRDDPPDSSLSGQVTGEFFYRVRLAQNLAITPRLQLLKDPALNPDDDTVWIWGIRVRMTL